jgi:hypothetical protein
MLSPFLPVAPFSRFVEKTSYLDRTSKGPYITRLKFVPALQRMFACEGEGTTLKVATPFTITAATTTITAATTTHHHHR